MNLYDKKIVKCNVCKKSLGEVDFDVNVFAVKCKNCENKKTNYEEPSYNFLNRRMIETI
jgi:ribosomal protein S27E